MKEEKKQKTAQRRESMPEGDKVPTSKAAPALQLQANPIAQMEDGKKEQLIAKAIELATAGKMMATYVTEQFKSDKTYMATEIAALVTKMEAGTSVDDAAKELVGQIELAFILSDKTSSLDLLGEKKSKTYRKKNWHALGYPDNYGNPSKAGLKKDYPMDIGKQVYALEQKKNGESKKEKKAEIQKEIDTLLGANPDVKEAYDDGKTADVMHSQLGKIRPERRANQGASGVLTQADLKGLDKEEKILANEFVTSKLEDVTGFKGEHLHIDARDAFLLMVADAKKDGVEIGLQASHRSEGAAKSAASKSTGAAIAKYSAHTLGLAVDVSLNTKKKSYGTETSTSPMNEVIGKRESPVHKWIFVKGAQYGWFPYQREPWHWEYNPSGFRDKFHKEMDEYIAKNRKAKK